MPAMAQKLSVTSEEHTETLVLCQCSACGLVQLDNLPVWYWQEEIRTDNTRVEELSKDNDFVSCNRLEHIPNPNEYLKQFNGRGIIEVPNFNMIYSKSMFAEIMLDHLMYFTEDTLRFTLQYNGFDVISIDPVWDYYILSAQVRRRKPLSMDAFDIQQARLRIALHSYISRYEHVAIYGASHQAFAYIATLQPKVDFIVDDSELKQFHYSPVGGLFIYPPEVLKLKKFECDAVVIMGAGYSDIIADNLQFDGGVAIMRDWGVEVVK
jgi:hypothetical protein